MKYENVIFDWNGTLIDDVLCGVETINESLKKRGLPEIDREKYLHVFRFPVIEYYKALGFDFAAESFEEVAKEYVKNYLEREPKTELFPEAKEVLAVLKSKKSKLFILSASEKTTLLNALEKRDAAKYFDGIYALDDIYAASKVELGKRLLSALSDPKNCLMVGDTEHDYEVAKELGFDCVLCPRGHAAREKLEATGAPIIENLYGVISLVFPQNAGSAKRVFPTNPGSNERRSFDLAEAEPRDFRTKYKDFYDDVKNTNKTEDW